MPRFVLLRHLCPAGYEKSSHWDFMLEWTGALRTWELRELPTIWWIALGDVLPDSAKPATYVVQASRLADHRLAYLDYEGPLSHNRGSVSRSDAGTYTLTRETGNRLDIQLAGERLQGETVLELDKAHQDHWHLRAES
jgi:hypothetical protein